MKKIKLIGLLIIVLGLFFSVESKLPEVDAFDVITECQLPLTTFSDGSSTFNISFPPGGGTTCDTIADCPTIRLPDNATIFSMKVDMELTNPASEIGTPYVWVPITSSNQVAQLRTSDATEIDRYTVIGTPSRITVMPGGDVWVASRTGNGIAKLSPLSGMGPAGGSCPNSSCGSDENIYFCPNDCTGVVCDKGGVATNCEKYEVTYTGTASGKAKGITFDNLGNIWTGDYDSNTITKLVSSGAVVSKTTTTNANPTFHHVYGMIGDPYGHVWMIVAADNSNPGNVNRRVLYFNTNTGVFGPPIACTMDGSNYLYGIGMDSEGNILAANYRGGGACKIGGVGSGSLGNVIETYGDNGPGCLNIGVACATDEQCCSGECSGGSCDFRSGNRGIAVDGNNNVWIANSATNNVYVYNEFGTLLKVINTGCANVIGVAIDFDDNAWVVSYGSGRVLKYGAVGGANEFNELTNPATDDSDVGGNPYNYSDMTGLRTVPKSLVVGSSGISVPLSGTNTFNICTGTCDPPATTCGFLVAATTCGDSSGFCEIPLEIFSMQAGDYTLKNLEVIYGKQVPITTGGLVPCGRDWNDDATPWDDRVPCTLCHLMILLNQGMDFLMKIASVIAILAFIITGFLFIISAGNPERKNNAKESFKWIIVGFLIIFLSWLFVDFLLSAWGFLDPLGGEWKVVCE